MLLFFKSNKLNSLFITLMMLITWFIYSFATNFENINSQTFIIVLTIILIGAVFHLNLDEFKNIEKQKNIFLFLFCFYQFNTSLFTQNLTVLTSLSVFIIVLIGLKNTGSLSTHYAFISSFVIGIVTINDPVAIIYLILIYSSFLIKSQFSLRFVITIIIGFFTPIILYYFLLYFNQNKLPNLNELIIPKIITDNFNIETIYDNKLTSYFYILLSFSSVILGLKRFKQNSVKERKNMTYILIFILLNSLYLLIEKTSNGLIKNYEVVIINKALLIGFILINIKKKWYGELLFLSIITIEIINFYI